MMKIIIFVIGMVSFFITIDFNAVKGYEWQFLLPLIFSFLYIFFAPSINKIGTGYLVLNVVWLIRYCFTPVLIKLSDYQIRYYSFVTDEDLYIALVLMIIELGISIISSNYFYKKIFLANKLDSKFVNIKDTSNIVRTEGTRAVGFTLLAAMLVLSLIIIIMDSSALNGFNFIFNSDFVNKSNESFGVSVLIIYWTKIVITVYLISKLGSADFKSRNTWNFWISIFIVLVSISFFNGTARNAVLVEGLAYMYLLIRLFPIYKKRILILFLSALSVMLFTITIVRFYDTRNISEGLENYNIESVAGMFNSYFAGLQNVAIGVRSLYINFSEYNLFTLLKDLLGNTIYFNKFVSDFPGTVEMFNAVLYRHSLWADQISPTITQGLALFNVIGVFVPSIIIYFVIKMDRTAMETHSTFKIFLVTLIAVNLAFFSPGNISILFTTVTNKFIPLLILYKISLLKIKKY